MSTLAEMASKAGFGGQQRNTLAVKLELFRKEVIKDLIDTCPKYERAANVMMWMRLKMEGKR